MQEPVLSHPNPILSMHLNCNASTLGTSAILSVKKPEDGKWHSCAFYSKGFNLAKRNYDIYDRELLAIIRTLEEWHHHLEGATHQIEIPTNHKNLEYWKSPQKLTHCQARWVQIL